LVDFLHGWWLVFASSLGKLFFRFESTNFSGNNNEPKGVQNQPTNRGTVAPVVAFSFG
jgi:hypothetical protein